MSQVREISVLSLDETPSLHHKFKTATRGEERTNAPGVGPSVDGETSRETALTALTAVEERKLIRKIDWRLIPLLSMLYLMKKIDENNVSSQRFLGPDVDSQHDWYILTRKFRTGLQCPHYEQGNGRKHTHTAWNHLRPIRHDYHSLYSE